MKLTDKQWTRLEPIILRSVCKKDTRGRKPRDPREVLNGILWMLLDSLFIAEKSEKLIGDKAYDSDKIDNDLLKKHSVEMIAPQHRNRTKPKTQDGRKLRRYQRRWQVERLFAWLQNFRRLVVKYERHADNFLSFLLLACSVILLRSF